MNAARILRAMVRLTYAAHRAFVNSVPSVIHSDRIIRAEDYNALCVAVASLGAQVATLPPADGSAPMRVETALKPLFALLEIVEKVNATLVPYMATPVEPETASSQVHPESALPSRPDYGAGSGAQSAPKSAPGAADEQNGIAAAANAARLTDAHLLEIAAEQDYGDEDPKCILRLCRAVERAALDDRAAATSTGGQS